jgi:DNA-binding NarL/FixJ family response regulator
LPGYRTPAEPSTNQTVKGFLVIFTGIQFDNRMDHTLTKILIADNQFLAAEGLSSLLESDGRFIPFKVDTHFELTNALDKELFGLLITDFAMPAPEGLDSLRQIRRRFPEMPVLILTNTITRSEFTELSGLGIKNIIYKTADKDEILMAVFSAIKNKKYYSGEILDLVIGSGEARAAVEEPAHLTATEIEIVRLISSGLTTKEIAMQKNISFHTVTTHRKNIFRKLGVSSVSELIIQAIKAGWIDNIEYYI